MSTMIQIRHVPDPVHRRLKARAAKQGKTLSGYLLEEIERLANKPTIEEMLARLAKLPPVKTSISSEDLIRAERDAR